MKKTRTKCHQGTVFTKKETSKKTIPVILIFLLTFFFVSPPMTTRGSVFFDLKPRELRILEITEQGLLVDTMKQKNDFPKEVKKVLETIPCWIKTDLLNQFKEMVNRPIVPYIGSSPATGDLNHDGTLDLVIGSSKGFLRVFINRGIQQKSSLEFNTQIDYPTWKDSEINPAVFDLNADGYADLVLGVNNQLFILFNKKESEKVAFSDPVLWFESEYSPGQRDNITPCTVDIDSKLGVILGHSDGSLSLLIKENGKWIENIHYFLGWKTIGNATPTVFPTNKNGYILVVGNQAGKLPSFALQLSRDGLREMRPLTLLDEIKTPGDSSPAFYDVDNNGRIDIIFCSNEEPASYLLNKGTNAVIDFQILNSDAENNLTISIYGGSSFNRDFDPLYANNFNHEVSASIAKFILSVEKKYQDEIAYCIANMQVQDLVSYVKYNRLYLLEENVREIYRMCDQVAYVKMKEFSDSTTLSYNTATGWKDMPAKIYYNYLVMLNRYLVVPNSFESLHQKNFFRSYLPYDNTYGITLLNRVKGAKTLYDAAYQVMFWLKEDIGGVWSNGKKPPGWFYIYKNLTNPDAGLWCGEWSIIYEACARAMNIPTISIVSLGEDHQFNNFWADSWHHLDASAGESTVKGTWKPYFDNSLIYYTTWGDRLLSWPMENEENGKYNHVWRSELSYNPEELLSDVRFVVKDKKGVPIDGARIELWSHWSVESKGKTKPFITAYSYTNCDGETLVKKLGPQNYTVIVVCRIGSTTFPLPLKKQSNQTIQVEIDNEIQSIYPFDTLGKQSEYQLIKPLEVTYQIRLSQFTQNNVPIIETFNTVKQYINLWKQDIGKAKVYLLSETELGNLKAGLPLGSGEERNLSGYDLVSFSIPDSTEKAEKYYLVFWNPNFATQMKVKVE